MSKSKQYYDIQGGVIKKSMNIDSSIDMCVCASSKDQAISLVKSYWHYPEECRIDSIRETTSDYRINSHGKSDSFGNHYVIDSSSQKHQF